MNILEATVQFERWLAQQLPIVRADLALKHEEMARQVFPFFRATFYRWAQLWPAVCDELKKAPTVLAVGDLHVENFGTWRDSEGRLIWGVNDLDEAWPAPYTLDLVRLATSAHLAIEDEHLSLSRRAASEAVEEGYRDGIAAGGRPFVLAEHNRWLRLLALGRLRDPVRYWRRIEQLPAFKAKLPAEVKKLIEASLPFAKSYELKKRVAGVGSLGHPRILALSRWRGAYIAREAKATRPSAWVWVKSSSATDFYSEKLIECAVRVPDPCVSFHGKWMVRRLAPDCSRIELSSLPEGRDESRLLYSMGWETANIHLGSVRPLPALRKDLAGRHGRWLHKAAKAMYAAALQDWKKWRNGWKHRLQEGAR